MWKQSRRADPPGFVGNETPVLEPSYHYIRDARREQRKIGPVNWILSSQLPMPNKEEVFSRS